MESAVTDYAEKHVELQNGSVKLFVDKSNRPDLDSEIFADITLKKYPAREFNNLLNNMKNVLDTYEKTVGHRNHKKDKKSTRKHALHLTRLYLMGLDILERGDIVTYRETEREFLLEIRNGKFMNEDGTYQPEFFDMIHDYEQRLAYAKEHTNLPVDPDLRKINEFVMDINRRSL